MDSWLQRTAIAGMLSVSLLSGAFGDDDLRVSATSLRVAYVLGEPILLTVTVQNLGTEPVEYGAVHRRTAERDIGIRISGDGVTYYRWTPRFPDDVNTRRQLLVLKPGSTDEYSVRILFSDASASSLAIPKPGTYFVKVWFPLFTASSAVRRQFESQPVAVVVNGPRDADLNLWATLRASDWLYFVQFGVATSGVRLPRDAVDIVRRNPNSSYVGGLKWALNEYYRKSKYAIRKGDRSQELLLEQIETVVRGFEDAHGPFQEDRRLDVSISYRFTNATPLDDVYKSVSLQAGVPLDIAPSLAKRRLQSVEVTQTLRAFMEAQCAYRAKWIRDGDGYRLVPFADQK